MTDAELDAVAWFSPGHYPSRLTPEIAHNIALEVAKGATLLQAAGIHGVAQRVREWYKQGYEASLRDTDWSDPHAVQLQLFLQVNQAYGYAGAQAQQRLLRTDPAWWLLHSPEARAEAQSGSVMAQLNPPEVTVAAAGRTTPVVPTDAQSIRERIRLVLEAGGGLAQPTVEGKVREEGSGTDGR